MSPAAVYRSPLCRYLEAIRSPQKALYARAYVAWVVRGSMREEEPEPARGELSSMAAQAVRMRVAEVLAGDEPQDPLAPARGMLAGLVVGALLWLPAVWGAWRWLG